MDLGVEEIGREQGVTYLKVTCSVTGMHYTPAKIQIIVAGLQGGAADIAMIKEELQRIYLGCYGLQLRIVVLSIIIIASLIR